ncbi:uncharacterized protein F4822DRAFT_402415 [Hypoxylon trugodes]|uniref:uncharacterized protein n=1 Tax=Hypoxylon trugodes TaxID=326681 RepID=UPI0021A21490|nr:uncharacterized protein F4822DRAFT_402415 [Hypoxylon trugodes]KAI1388294.1 hypothetical protein F4822DRAFT_402415 [Hypoxylon trugodes]
MAGRGTKRKADLRDEPDNLLLKNNDAKRSKARKRLSRLEEYDEDEGRESSRNFQRWAEIFESNTKGEVAKSKAFVKNFEAKVNKQKDKMRDYIQEQEKKLIGGKDQFAGVFERLCSAAVPFFSTPKASGDKGRGAGKENHVLFNDAQSIISGGYALLNQFREADERLKKHKIEFPTAKWKQDTQDMKELLACGRKHGVKLVEEKLDPKAYPSPEPDTYKAGEKDDLVSELFKNSRKISLDDNWGDVAAEQMRKITDLIKTVPVKSERAKKRV